MSNLSPDTQFGIGPAASRPIIVSEAAVRVGKNFPNQSSPDATPLPDGQPSVLTSTGYLGAVAASTGSVGK
ncbi:MAG: hypothetical protein US52_C0008G0007 [candidate division WS6 bacterium GW2011_GWA2_37_6]|uniref:Uncharacterized protein n=1 Tax=candidate division WS6 bacterium GW2011_GWA2_37_6 TaxID=1619087 RepID=A0A0G0GYV0_9BACT|nr:MAG: hypothetical protein US52_C0008G0007 [candidate division WS6 bacterium GW2011_GWA2_37_6]